MLDRLARLACLPGSNARDARPEVGRMHAVRKALVEVEECGRSHRVGRTHRRVICLLAPTCGGDTTEDRAQTKHPLFGTIERASTRQKRMLRQLVQPRSAVARRDSGRSQRAPGRASAPVLLLSRTSRARVARSSRREARRRARSRGDRSQSPQPSVTNARLRRRPQ
jgi:hypothetical protein